MENKWRRQVAVVENRQRWQRTDGGGGEQMVVESGWWWRADGVGLYGVVE
jgi:hypothetical protein